jgi:hypothetical protein
MKRKTTPIVSRVLPCGTLIETLFDVRAGTTALVIATPGKSPAVVPHHDLPDGTRLVPYAPTNGLLTSGCVLLPSALVSPGDVGDFGDLVADARSYIARYVDLSDGFLDLATHYVLLSWVYDAFNELPYLRFLGRWGSGKTRGLLTIGSICYKPFFASGASTVSPLFHILDGFGGTLVLDEADLRFSDATADLTKILNNGNVRGLPVLRTMQSRDGELCPRAFRVFGPKLIAMREPFQDEALESRFLTEETGMRPLRADIPISLPGRQKSEAEALRNRLLAWRLRDFHRVKLDPSLVLDTLSPRANQIALPLLSLSEPPYRDRLIRELAQWEARDMSKRAGTPDAVMLRAVRDAFDTASTSYVSIANVMERFNDANMPSTGQALSAKSVGHIVRKRLHLATTKTRGIYVVPGSERAKVAALSRHYGIDDHDVSWR